MNTFGATTESEKNQTEMGHALCALSETKQAMTAKRKNKSNRLPPNESRM